MHYIGWSNNNNVLFWIENIIFKDTKRIFRPSHMTIAKEDEGKKETSEE